MTGAATDETGEDHAASARRLGLIRLAIGLVQGLGLFLLYRTLEPLYWIHSTSSPMGPLGWPATVPGLYAPLVLIFAWLPVVVLGGVGRMRPRTLLIWSVAAAALLALLGWWSIFSGFGREGVYEPVASPVVFMVSAAALFILHHLILPADQAGRPIAPYPAYFDTAWKAGVQLALSAGFTLAFWVLLFLGAGLFNVIGLDFLWTLIRQEWFAIPVTTLVFAAAVHLTDVRDGLIRGVRTVALMLLSWLLPVIVALAAGFLSALPFTGLSGLWEAGGGAALMLSASAALIILINAGYQDGEPDGRPHITLQWAARTGGVLLVPLIGLALWGIALRIGQHGLTPERIIAFACVVVGAVHAGGYAFSALRPGPWMKPLERTNLIGAVVAVAVIVALFTPLADPARLSVADQTRRLETGRVAAEGFDYAFLRFRAGASGERALERLARSEDAEIARRAREARAAGSRYDLPHAGRLVVTRQIVMAPGTGELPDGFVESLPEYGMRGDCAEPLSCVAALHDLDGDGVDEVLVATQHRLSVFHLDAETQGWTETGAYWPYRCVEERGDVRTYLSEGGRPNGPALPTLEIDGRAVPIQPASGCP